MDKPDQNSLEPARLPTFSLFFLTALFLFVVGWGGLALVTYYTLPTLGPRWLFFFLIVLALTGTSLPIIYFLNKRFPTRPPVGGEVIMRQALWFGIYGSLISWLQMGRVLTLVLAIILFFALIVIEGLLRLFERSRWRPN